MSAEWKSEQIRSILVFFGSIRAGWFLKQRLLSTSTLRRDCIVALTVYAALMAALVGFRVARAAEADQADQEGIDMSRDRPHAETR